MAKIPDIRFARVSKNGTSRGVNIPRVLLEQLHWHDGTALELWIAGDCLVMAEAVTRRGTLEQIDTVEHAAAPARQKRGSR